MQIAFEDQSASTNHSVSLEFFNRHYTVYSRTYLCFGIVEARRYVFQHIANGTAHEVWYSLHVTVHTVLNEIHIPYTSSIGSEIK